VRGAGRFIVEVSMDETDQPQTPDELLFILSAVAEEGIPAQTIAPKFTGRFNKGVDYVGDVDRFAREFGEDVRVAAFAVAEFGLPSSLKLSVHSGSDKFSLYPVINRVLRETGAGLHLKTAGTTWLEEVAGLALAGGDGPEIVREVYEKAMGRFDELCGPYATVLNIRADRLPSPAEVRGWEGRRFAACLRHDQSEPRYNADMRQLMHVAYKVAVEMGARYLAALDANESVVGDLVTENLLKRHIEPVFKGC
jgi:tagaturonate epimerase